MGAYLSKPVTVKESEEGCTKLLKYGASSMQGWRRTMEDAHIVGAQIEGGRLFGVFDGHGGAEVARFVARHAVDEVSPEWRETPERELKRLFHRMDELLRDPSNAGELESLKNSAGGGAQSNTQQQNNNNNNNSSGDAVMAKEAMELFQKMIAANSSSGPVVGQQAPQLGATSPTGEAPTPLTALAAPGRQGATTTPDDNDDDDDDDRAQQSSSSSPLPPPFQLQQQPLPRLDEPLFQARRRCELPDHPLQAGCTAVVVALDERRSRLYCANAGDSRAVVCRRGEAVALSQDHKPDAPVETARITAAGGYVESANGFFRVNGNLNLSRAIGDLKYKQNADLSPAEQIITAEPDVVEYDYTPDDRFFLVACDGIWDCLTNQEAVDFVATRIDAGFGLASICEQIFDRCLAENPRESRGIGGDNMTCLIVQFQHHHHHHHHQG